MPKQFVVRLRRGSPTGTIVANSQVITINPLSGTSIFPSNFSDGRLQGKLTTNNRVANFLKTIVAQPTTTTTRAPTTTLAPGQTTTTTTRVSTTSTTTKPTFNPVIVLSNTTIAVNSNSVLLRIQGAPTAAANGGTVVNFQFRKKATVSGFFGAGYVADTWINASGVLNSTTTLTLEQSGEYLTILDPFPIAGTVTFEFTFPTNSAWTYVNGNTRSVNITVTAGAIGTISTSTTSTTTRSLASPPVVTNWAPNPSSNQINELTAREFLAQFTITDTVVRTVYWKVVGNAGLTGDDFDGPTYGNFDTVIGSTSKSVFVKARNDALIEPSETFSIMFFLSIAEASTDTNAIFVSPLITVQDGTNSVNEQVKIVDAEYPPYYQGSLINFLLSAGVAGSTVEIFDGSTRYPNATLDADGNLVQSLGPFNDIRQWTVQFTFKATGHVRYVSFYITQFPTGI